MHTLAICCFSTLSADSVKSNARFLFSFDYKVNLNWYSRVSLLCFRPGDNLTSQQAPPPIPPAPPPHKQHPSVTSLSRSSLANQRSPSPPPTAGLAADLQSTAECVQLQDSWVLGSNVALESRWVTHSASRKKQKRKKHGSRCQIHWLRKQDDTSWSRF